MYIAGLVFSKRRHAETWQNVPTTESMIHAENASSVFYFFESKLNSFLSDDIFHLLSKTHATSRQYWTGTPRSLYITVTWLRQSTFRRNNTLASYWYFVSYGRSRFRQVIENSPLFYTRYTTPVNISCFLATKSDDKVRRGRASRLYIYLPI